MPGVPPDLHQRVCAALIDSGYCDDAAALRRLFVDERLAPWRHTLPDADSPRCRAEAVIAKLWDQHTTGGDNALALLCHTLSEHFEGKLLGQTLAELAEAVEAVAPPPPGIALTHARLHTLPPPPADFVGREQELETLLQAVETGGATISGLRGMGGVGKTTLALKLAQLLAPRYPDAQFYLDLRGVDPHPLTPAEVMTAILRAYHPTARLPEDEAQLQPLYCAVLNGQRALLLLDNAKDAAQLRPLLPPASCLLLVTSRQRFTLPGLRPLDLDALPKPDAEKLLREIAPRLGDHAATLADLCGCLPIALRWAGDALNDTTVAVPRFLERLHNERRLLKPAEAALRLSYDLLPPDLQALWRRLSVFPADFDWLAAAAVWDLDREPAEDALDALARRSLILLRPRAGENRYALHDLARLWAAEQTTAEERAEAAYRHAAHYKDVLAAADEFYLQGNPLAGLALYDREAANIHAGFAWACAPAPDAQRKDAEAQRRKETDEPFAPLRPGDFALKNTQCSAYPDAGVYILALRLHPCERIHWLEAALRAARALGCRDVEGWHLSNLGNAYADLGDVRRAIKFYEQQLVIACEIGDRRGAGAALGNLGIAYKCLGNVHRAIEFYEQALQIARETGDQRWESTALGNLGLAYAALGDARHAIEFYEQALEIEKEIVDRRAEGSTLGSLGLAYVDLGDTRRAIAFYEQALKIEKEIGDRRARGSLLVNLGIAYNNLEDVCRAIEYYEQALVIIREIGDRRGESITSWNLGLAYEKQGRYAEACELMRVTVEFERAIGHPDAEPDAQRLAEVCAKA